MDFVSDALFDGRRLRALTIVDAFTREALAIEVDQGIKGEQVVAAVARLALLRGAPRAIQVDNGPEFVSKALTAGPTRTASRWTSRGLANRPTTRWSSRSTAACATSD
ncbi:transposase InsO family protein [Methylobacterium sp. R2-1]|nr:transposase InsO family protein [Methylobacterium sp. R2-1]